MTKRIFQKYKNGILGPANAVYNAFYDDNYYYMQFNDRFWYDRELHGLSLIASKYYAPNINIDESKLLITFDWGISLNHALEHNTAPDDYKEQVTAILEDLVSNNIYKINAYPWTFFVIDGQVKLMDCYACTTLEDEIPFSLIEDIINDNNRFIFKDNMLDVKETYKKTLEYEKEFWPEEFLNG